MVSRGNVVATLTADKHRGAKKGANSNMELRGSETPPVTMVQQLGTPSSLASREAEGMEEVSILRKS